MRFFIIVEISPEGLRLLYLILVALLSLVVGPGALALLRSI
jgi:hypothetical protein